MRPNAGPSSAVTASRPLTRFSLYLHGSRGKRTDDPCREEVLIKKAARALAELDA
jgi:hypothetical protein